MKYQGKEFKTVEEVQEYIVEKAKNDAFTVAQERGIEARDYDEWEEEYIDNCIAEFEILRAGGSVLLTENGFVEGWFIGSVEYAVGGDAETGWETDISPAFMTRDRKVYMAERGRDKIWRFTNPNKVGYIRWGMYPKNWPAEKTHPSFINPPRPKHHEKSLNNSKCTFMYTVRYCRWTYEYKGTSRTKAAEAMKRIKAMPGHIAICDVLYEDALPF